MLGKCHFQKFFAFFPSPIIKGVIAILMSQNRGFLKIAHIRVDEAKMAKKSKKIICNDISIGLLVTNNYYDDRMIIICMYLCAIIIIGM